MSTKTTGRGASYTRHSAEYKRETLKLATQIGVAKADKQLGLKADLALTLGSALPSGIFGIMN